MIFANRTLATEDRPMELLINQILAGIATGSIYACMALSVVMIYQAIDHLNFAQGEMATFSAFVAWQLMRWGIPFLPSFVLTVIVSFSAGASIQKGLFRPLAYGSGLTKLAGFLSLFAIVSSVTGVTWG